MIGIKQGEIRNLTDPAKHYTHDLGEKIVKRSVWSELN